MFLLPQQKIPVCKMRKVFPSTLEKVEYFNRGISIGQRILSSLLEKKKLKRQTSHCSFSVFYSENESLD